MVEQRKTVIASSADETIKPSVNVFVKGIANNFPLSVNPDQVRQTTEKLRDKSICFICNRVPLEPSINHCCGQYFCASC